MFKPLNFAVMIRITRFRREAEGFDISVLDYAEKAKKHFKGLIPYLYGVIKTIHNFRSVELSVEADGKEYFNGEGLVVAVTNGQFYGGGIKISPEASPNDGLLDVVVMRPAGKQPERVPNRSHLFSLPTAPGFGQPSMTSRRSLSCFAAPRMMKSVSQAREIMSTFRAFHLRISSGPHRP